MFSLQRLRAKTQKKKKTPIKPENYKTLLKQTPVVKTKIPKIKKISTNIPDNTNLKELKTDDMQNKLGNKWNLYKKLTTDEQSDEKAENFKHISDILDLNTSDNVPDLKLGDPLKQISRRKARRDTRIKKAYKGRKGLTKKVIEPEATIDNVQNSAKTYNFLDSMDVSEVETGIANMEESIEKKHNSEKDPDIFNESLDEDDINLSIRNKGKYFMEIEKSKNVKLANELNISTLDEGQYITKDDQLYMSVKAFSKNSLLVALFPDSKIYFHGFYKLKLITGSVSVLGYKFKPGEQQVVYSPASHSLLPIHALEGTDVKNFNDETLNKLKIPNHWVRNINVSKNQPMVIIKLSKYESNMTRILHKSKFLPIIKSSSFDLDIWKETVGVHLEDHNEPKMQLLYEPCVWNEIISQIKSYKENGSRTCVMVAGGKSVGKSTFVKFLINSLLSSENINEVACLDLDPGQPEFSFTSILSLSKITSPSIGPSYAHADTSTFSYKKEYLVADVNVQETVKEYIDGVMELSRKLNEFDESIPIICNTMGFTATLGFDIMVDVIKNVEPTHIIEITSHSSNRNFKYSLDCNSISTIDRGVLKSTKILNYDLITIDTSSKSDCMRSRPLRNMTIMSCLSKLWSPNEVNINSETIQPPIKLDWCSIAIQVQGCFIPKTHILQAINASLVALCKIDSECLEKIDDNFPLKVKDDIAWNRYTTCLGWGVVQGIDPETREIYLLSHIRLEALLDLNMLVLPKVPLPKEFYNLFYYEGAPYCGKG